MEELVELNAGLKRRGVRLAVEEKRGRLWTRGTFKQPDGSSRRRRIPLELDAAASNLLEAELRVLQLHGLIRQGRQPDEAPWLKSKVVPGAGRDQPRLLTCEEGIARLQSSWWKSRARTSAAERSWARIQTELVRLPPGAELTIGLLAATISTKTEPGSRSRLESVKVYRRLGKLVGLEGLEQLSELMGTYSPEERDLPSEEALEAFLTAIRPTKWGWVTCAAATFGCRPAEIPSLEIHEDGTAGALSVKVKGRMPVQRTCFALPRAWIDRFDLRAADIPGGARWTRPAQYDSDQARRWVQAWRQGLRSRAAQKALALLGTDGFTAYDLRHAWAIRSIRSGLPMTICAKAMGHSAAVHERQYHRWLQAESLREAMAALG
jgi:integrase